MLYWHRKPWLDYDNNTWIWLRKGNLKRETESLLNNTIKTNYIKAKIDKTQQNSKCSYLVIGTRRSII